MKPHNKIDIHTLLKDKTFPSFIKEDVVLNFFKATLTLHPLRRLLKVFFYQGCPIKCNF